MSTITTEEILRYKKALEETPSEEEILEILPFLEEIEVDRALLAKTKIGVAVTRFKQHSNGHIATRCKKLVEKWRSVVAQKPKGVKSPPPSQQSGPSTTLLTPIPTPVDSPQAVDAISGGLFNDSAVGKGDIHGPYTGPRCGDIKRDKAREILYKGFLEGMPADQTAELSLSSAAQLVASMEEELWIAYANSPKEYQTQLRSIRANFADKKNPELNVRVYLGAISIKTLATMAAVEMASDAKKAERQKARKDALEACQSDWDLRNIKRAAGQFPCGKCKSANTSYFQMQTRSSDEPMTTFVNCLECGNRWKF